MPGWKCVVPNCESIYEKNTKISTFQIPKYTLLRKKWETALKCALPLNLSTSSRVCEKHFNPNDIKDSSNPATTVDGRVLFQVSIIINKIT